MFAPFVLTNHQSQEKEQIRLEKYENVKQKIDSFIKVNSLDNKRPSYIFDGSFLMDEPKSGQIYQISYLCNYIKPISKNEVVVLS